MLESDELHKASVLVFANKQDVAGCMSATEISQQLSLQNLRKHQWQIQACCGLTGEGWVTRFASSRWTHTCVFFRLSIDPHLCFFLQALPGAGVDCQQDQEVTWGLGVCCRERGAWVGPAFKFIQGYCDACGSRYWCSFHIFPLLFNCLEIFTKSVPTLVTKKNCSNVFVVRSISRPLFNKQSVQPLSHMRGLEYKSSTAKWISGHQDQEVV